MVDKYSWVDMGSSYLMSDMQAAYLWGQICKIEEINRARLVSWSYYFEKLLPFENKGLINLARPSTNANHNAHMFFIKVKDINTRQALISSFKENDINAVFHYVPLHTSTAGQKFGRFNGIDEYTTKESERLIRLPLFHGLTISEQDRVIECLKNFYKYQENI
jgi:dTDP-4-amino-4,6-dideoxygalactose transaminase